MGNRILRAAAALLLLTVAACSSDEPTAPELTTIMVTASPSTLTLGQTVTATAVGADQGGSPFTVGAVTWSSSAASVATVDAQGLVKAVSAGAADIVATVGTRTGKMTVTVTAPPAIEINEVESNGGTPGDWAEFYNGTSTSVDLSGWVMKDNDDTHLYAFPAGMTIAAGGYLVAEEAQFTFGLGAPDAVRLYNKYGVLVDSYDWTTHAATTYGRCPNGSGAFATTASSTKGAANTCGAPPTAVKINEVESSGGVPGDWVELYNTSAVAADISGWIFRDNDDTHKYVIPAGKTIAPGGYYMLEEADFGFGLGSPDMARLFLPDGTTVVDSYGWTPHATTTYGRCPNGTGDFTTTTSVTKAAANDCGVPVKINEVESNGGVPGDWVELYNPSPAAVDLSGLVFRDNDDTHNYTIPAGTTIAAGGYYLLEEAQFTFGLGAPDAARLFAKDGTTLIDSYSWTTHATTTYGRCPDSSGDFTTTTASTKGAANACPGVVSVAAWPGDATIRTADVAGTFGQNLSGFAYEGSGSATPGVLWAARNGPSSLFRLLWDGTQWIPDTANGWSAGKQLRYTDGTGNPDAESVTFAGGGSAGGLYVGTERNNDVSGTSRPTVLLYGASGSATELTATREWNLTADLPVVGANLGIEGITWIPDTYLTAHGFFDEGKNKTYAPADYPNHGTGLFFVGIEANGIVYAYALDQNTSNSFSRVATISSVFPSVMEVSFDRELGYLWAVCDDGCSGRSSVLEIGANGRFTTTREFERPSGMSNINNEGFGMATLSECVAAKRPVFWSDDNNDDNHAIRQGTITCTPFGGSPVSSMP